MRFGLVVPYVDSREFTEVARSAEAAGWDAVFTYECVWGVDAWVTLAAAAMVTERIRLGTLLTPAARFRPWDLASRVASVDRLSGGRAIMSVGLGALNPNWLAFEADEGRRTRREKLDDSLAVYDGLMRGQPFVYEGRHYSARPTEMLVPPMPVQRPRPPVWVVGAHVLGADRQRSLARAAHWDGVLPTVIDGSERSKTPTPEHLSELVGLVLDMRAESGRSGEAYDVVLEADSYGGFVQTTPNDPAVWEAAGATWWVESWWDLPDDHKGLDEVRRRVLAGPPRGQADDETGDDDE